MLCVQLEVTCERHRVYKSVIDIMQMKIITAKQIIAVKQSIVGAYVFSLFYDLDLDVHWM